MIVNSDVIIENKPKDCNKCPKILCGGLTSDKIYIYTNHRNDTTIFPSCVDNLNKFLIVTSPLLTTRFSSLLEAIDSMLDSSTCELEEAIQLTKIKNMI